MASMELTTRQVYEYKTFRLKIDNDYSPSPINFTSHGMGNLSGSAESLKICHLLEPEADVQVWLLPREGVLIGSGTANCHPGVVSMRAWGQESPS